MTQSVARAQMRSMKTAQRTAAGMGVGSVFLARRFAYTSKQVISPLFLDGSMYPRLRSARRLYHE
eukprot:4945080-Lingulodinium_polyedra.AAC.1